MFAYELYFFLSENTLTENLATQIKNKYEEMASFLQKENEELHQSTRELRKEVNETAFTGDSRVQQCIDLIRGCISSYMEELASQLEIKLSPSDMCGIEGLCADLEALHSTSESMIHEIRSKNNGNENVHTS